MINVKWDLVIVDRAYRVGITSIEKTLGEPFKGAHKQESNNKPHYLDYYAAGR